MVHTSIESEVAQHEREPSSERFRRQQLSSILWGVDWGELLPLSIDGVTVRLSTYDECVPFVRRYYATIFQEDGSGPFSTTRVDPAKERYYRLAGDFFSFEFDAEPIGLLIGTPADWGTYYIRSAAILPQHAGRRTIQSLLPRLFTVLQAAGVARVEADTSPSNLAVMTILTRLGFNVTGTVLTDRWGAHVQLTRYLAADREEIFLRQFCSGVRYQQQERPSSCGTITTEERSPP